MKRLAVCLPLLSALLLLAAGEASAKPLYRSFQSTRALGMGGAFTAVADDASALFLNPAGLDQLNTWSFAALNPTVEIGENVRGFYEDADEVDMNDADEVAQLLQDHMGEYLHARATLYPHYVTHRFGVALVGNAFADATPHNVAYPEVEVSAAGYAGVQVGMGLPIIEDHLHFGGSVKFLRGWTLSKSYDVIDITDDDFSDRLRDDMGRGTGFGLDIGALYTFADLPFKPSIGASMQNVFDTDMGDGGKLPMQLNFGVSAREEFLGWLTLTLAADYLDVAGNLDDKEEKYDVVKRLHAGLELWLTQRLGLRAGVYQGNPTFGATLDLWVLKAEYATYAEELGENAGATQDRRQVVQFSLGW